MSENHFRNLQAPLCGIFYPHSVAVARYAALIRIKSPTNWDSQLTKSLFRHALKHRFQNNCIIHLAVESKSLLPIINRKRKCQLINMASPKLKNLYRSCTATSYACMIFSFPASADTSISNVDSGRWKFVIRASIHLNLYPG